MIETKGLTAALEALDVMMKAAEVSYSRMEKIGSGLVTVLVKGEVGAVQAAVDAGTEAAGKLGEVVAAHVIPHPHADVARLMEAGGK
jgi:microcompartment protein CcmL/EutN